MIMALRSFGCRSLSYRDPDSNEVELTADNFEDLEAYHREFIRMNGGVDHLSPQRGCAGHRRNRHHEFDGAYRH